MWGQADMLWVWAVAEASSLPRPSCLNNPAPRLLGQEGHSCAGASVCTGGCLGPACLASTSTGTPRAGHALHIFSLQQFPPLLITLPFTTVAYFHSVLFLSPFPRPLAVFPLLFPFFPAAELPNRVLITFQKIFPPEAASSVLIRTAGPHRP